MKTCTLGVFGGTVCTLACLVVVAGCQRTIAPRNAKWVHLDDPDGHSEDHFGESVALNEDGTTLVVGVPKERTDRKDAGKAYVYTRGRGDWIWQDDLADPGGTADDMFGSAVAVSGDGNTLAVGAINGSQFDAGCVYVYALKESKWVTQKKLVGSSGRVRGDVFGSSLALSRDGKTLAVGASGASVASDDKVAGKVYVYTLSGGDWKPQVLDDPDRIVDDWFGYSLALNADGTTLAAGAPRAHTRGKMVAGKVYVRKFRPF